MEFHLHQYFVKIVSWFPLVSSGFWVYENSQTGNWKIRHYLNILAKILMNLFTTKMDRA